MTKWEEVKPAPTHDFAKDKEVVGRLIRVEEKVGPNESMLYTLKKVDGSQIAVWGSTVLDTRMKNVEIGEEVKIVFTGTEKSKTAGRQPYKVFTVFRKSEEVKEVIDEPREA